MKHLGAFGVTVLLFMLYWPPFRCGAFWIAVNYSRKMQLCRFHSLQGNGLECCPECNTNRYWHKGVYKEACEMQSVDT